MTKRSLGYVVLSGFLMAGVSLQAHHSLAGAYALGKEAKVTGTFKAFRLVNPHSSMNSSKIPPRPSKRRWETNIQSLDRNVRYFRQKFPTAWSSRHSFLRTFLRENGLPVISALSEP